MASSAVATHLQHWWHSSSTSVCRQTSYQAWFRTTIGGTRAGVRMCAFPPSSLSTDTPATTVVGTSSATRRAPEEGTVCSSTLRPENGQKAASGLSSTVTVPSRFWTSASVPLEHCLPCCSAVLHHIPLLSQYEKLICPSLWCSPLYPLAGAPVFSVLVGKQKENDASEEDVVTNENGRLPGSASPSEEVLLQHSPWPSSSFVPCFTPISSSSSSGVWNITPSPCSSSTWITASPSNTVEHVRRGLGPPLGARALLITLTKRALEFSVPIQEVLLFFSLTLVYLEGKAHAEQWGRVRVSSFQEEEGDEEEQEKGETKKTKMEEEKKEEEEQEQLPYSCGDSIKTEPMEEGNVPISFPSVASSPRDSCADFSPTFSSTTNKTSLPTSCRNGNTTQGKRKGGGGRRKRGKKGNASGKGRRRRRHEAEDSSSGMFSFSNFLQDIRQWKIQMIQQCVDKAAFMVSEMIAQTSTGVGGATRDAKGEERDPLSSTPGYRLRTSDFPVGSGMTTTTTAAMRLLLCAAEEMEKRRSATMSEDRPIGAASVAWGSRNMLCFVDPEEKEEEEDEEEEESSSSSSPDASSFFSSRKRRERSPTLNYAATSIYQALAMTPTQWRCTGRLSEEERNTMTDMQSGRVCTPSLSGTVAMSSSSSSSAALQRCFPSSVLPPLFVPIVPRFTPRHRHPFHLPPLPPDPLEVFFLPVWERVVLRCVRSGGALGKVREWLLKEATRQWGKVEKADEVVRLRNWKQLHDRRVWQAKMAAARKERRRQRDMMKKKKEDDEEEARRREEHWGVTKRETQEDEEEDEEEEKVIRATRADDLSSPCATSTTNPMRAASSSSPSSFTNAPSPPHRVTPSDAQLLNDGTFMAFGLGSSSFVIRAPVQWCWRSPSPMLRPLFQPSPSFMSSIKAFRASSSSFSSFSWPTRFMGWEGVVGEVLQYGVGTLQTLPLLPVRAEKEGEEVRTGEQGKHSTSDKNEVDEEGYAVEGVSSPSPQGSAPLTALQVHRLAITSFVDVVLRYDAEKEEEKERQKKRGGGSEGKRFFMSIPSRNHNSSGGGSPELLAAKPALCAVEELSDYLCRAGVHLRLGGDPSVSFVIPREPSHWIEYVLQQARKEMYQVAKQQGIVEWRLRGTPLGIVLVHLSHSGKERSLGFPARLASTSSVLYPPRQPTSPSSSSLPGNTPPPHGAATSIRKKDADPTWCRPRSGDGETRGKTDAEGSQPALPSPLVSDSEEVVEEALQAATRQPSHHAGHYTDCKAYLLLLHHSRRRPTLPPRGGREGVRQWIFNSDEKRPEAASTITIKQEHSEEDRSHTPTAATPPREKNEEEKEKESRQDAGASSSAARGKPMEEERLAVGGRECLILEPIILRTAEMNTSTTATPSSCPSRSSHSFEVLGRIARQSTSVEEAEDVHHKKGIERRMEQPLSVWTFTRSEEDVFLRILRCHPYARDIIGCGVQQLYGCSSTALQSWRRAAETRGKHHAKEPNNTAKESPISSLERSSEVSIKETGERCNAENDGQEEEFQLLLRRVCGVVLWWSIRCCYTGVCRSCETNGCSSSSTTPSGGILRKHGTLCHAPRVSWIAQCLPSPQLPSRTDRTPIPPTRTTGSHTLADREQVEVHSQGTSKTNSSEDARPPRAPPPMTKRFFDGLLLHYLRSLLKKSPPPLLRQSKVNEMVPCHDHQRTASSTSSLSALPCPSRVSSTVLSKEVEAEKTSDPSPEKTPIQQEEEVQLRPTQTTNATMCHTNTSMRPPLLHPRTTLYPSDRQLVLYALRHHPHYYSTVKGCGIREVYVSCVEKESKEADHDVPHWDSCTDKVGVEEKNQKEDQEGGKTKNENGPLGAPLEKSSCSPRWHAHPCYQPLLLLEYKCGKIKEANELLAECFSLTPPNALFGHQQIVKETEENL